MGGKIAILAVVILVLAGAYAYYVSSGSYALSLEARKLYDQGDYENAAMLARQAYDENPYNRMAFTVLTQASESKKWQNFIDMAQGYMRKTLELTAKERITAGDRNRIKLMAEVVMEDYKKLDPKNRMIAPELKDRAADLHRQFVQLYDDAFRP